MTKFTDIEHPTNRVWPGLPNYVLPTSEESYRNGYDTGFTWVEKFPTSHSYVPGGPWVGSSSTDRGVSALIDQEKRNHAEWMRGWHEGFQEYYSKREEKLPNWYRKPLF